MVGVREYSQWWVYVNALVVVTVLVSVGKFLVVGVRVTVTVFVVVGVRM